MKSHGYAARDAKSGLGPFSFERREPQAGDVAMEILYCGICHSDIHQVRNEWNDSAYPMVPGHEIVGRVTAHRPGCDEVQGGRPGRGGRDGGLVPGVRQLPGE
jgi:D-arabinose 1-dehydrogenase-like Zn-dependent alcohol dehydrogenase